MAFLTDAQLKTELAAVLKVPEVELATWWTIVITAANAAAQAEIKSALAKQGYPVADAQSWDRSAEFSRAIGLYWCLVNASVASQTQVNQQDLEKFNRRAELDTITIMIGDAVKSPTAGTGRVTRGKLLDDNDTIKADSKW